MEKLAKAIDRPLNGFASSKPGFLKGLVKNVHVETGHNFFFTQEAFNKYSKPEKYEEKIAKRHALFPLQQSHIGANPDSKRSLKKQIKEIITPVQRVKSLSDESEDEDIFGETSADLDEFGVGSSVVLKKEVKKTWKRKNRKAVAECEKNIEDAEDLSISAGVDISELEEFGVGRSVTQISKITKKNLASEKKTKQGKNVDLQNDTLTDNSIVHGKTNEDEPITEKKRKLDNSDVQNVHEEIANEGEIPVTHKETDISKSIAHVDIGVIAKQTNKNESFDENKTTQEKLDDYAEKDANVDGELQTGSKILMEHVKHKEVIHHNIEDLEEFGVDKNSSGNKKEETIKEESDNVHVKEKNKSLHEEFPWDTKYREVRRSEKQDMYKYQNRKSNLTSREQARYLVFHIKFCVNTPRNPSQKVKAEMKEFSELHERVAEEQKEFQQYLERLAQTMRADYNYLAPEADRYYKEKLALKRKRVHLYPKYYNVCDKLNLSTLGPPCQLLFVRSLLEMGTVPKLMLPSMEIGERPRIPIDYDSISKNCPCAHSKSSNIWNHEPCSQDQNCTVLSQQHRVHITISASAIACLVNNHAPSYNREWQLPFTVRDYELQDGDKKFMHRVVYIDNPLPAKELTGRDKNTTFYKYALRSHMGRFNQKGHIFSANQKADHDHQEASELPRQQSSAGQLQGLSSPAHRQESDVPFLSPLKSPLITKDVKKNEKPKIENEVTVEDDPFGTMDTSMEDLETFGTDLSKIKKSKNSSSLDHFHSNLEKEVMDNTHDNLSKHSEKKGDYESTKKHITKISDNKDSDCAFEIEKNRKNEKNKNVALTNDEKATSGLIESEKKEIISLTNIETEQNKKLMEPATDVAKTSQEEIERLLADTETVEETENFEQEIPEPRQELIQSELTQPEQEVTQSELTQPEQEITQLKHGLTQPLQSESALEEKVTEPEQELIKPAQEVSKLVEEVTKPVQEVAEPVQEVAEPVQEVIKPVQEVVESVQEVAEPLQEVAEPVQEIGEPVQEVAEPVQEVAEPLQEEAEPVHEIVEPVQEVAEPVQEISTHVQEITESVQEETEQIKDELKSIPVVTSLTELKIDPDNDITSQKSFNELQMSSASDEESDALVIDEPEEVKGQDLNIDETPASPIQEVCIEAPASPLADTPVSPTKLGISPNKGSPFIIPLSPSKQAVKSNSDRIMSPERTDRSSPTSPVKYSSPFGQPCKIIPLQRESEEENVIDNSNMITLQELFETSRNIGLRPKRRRSVKKHLTESDSGGTGKLDASKQSVDLMNSTTYVSSFNSDSKLSDDFDKTPVTVSSANKDQSNENTGTNSSCHKETLKQLEDSGESSDEVVSPRSKIFKKNKKSKSDFDFLSPRRRPRVIDSDSDNDDLTSAKMDTTLEKGDNSEMMNENNETNVSVQMKRIRKSSTDNETNKEHDNQSNLPSQRKRQKSGKCQSSFEGVKMELKTENIEEMACMRRTTRSVVGTRKKDKSFESQEIPEGIIPEKVSSRMRTKSLDGTPVEAITMETVSVTTRRQTRRSVDSVSANDEKRSNKLAILDRVKKSLSMTTKEDVSTDKQPECQNVPQKRKRGRPPKIKSTAVRAITPDIECTMSKPTETNNKITDSINRSDNDTTTDDKPADAVKRTGQKSEENKDDMEPKAVDNSGIGNDRDNSPNDEVSKHSVEGHQEIVNNSMEAHEGHNTEETNLSYMETNDGVNDESLNTKDLNSGQVNQSAKHTTGNEEKTKHVPMEIKHTVKEQTIVSGEKPSSQKTDHMKKSRPVIPAGQRMQQPKTSVNPLENIMQAQEKLLDNPKHHLDRAQQEYFSQFKFPERHNITYHLWSLGAYNVMVRCGYHGLYKDANQKVSFVHVAPKMEYQVEYGLEQTTTSEISKEWATAYVRPNCKIVRVRINPLQSEVVSMKEEELSKMRTSAHGFNQANGFQMLANVFHRLHQCSPGQYLLHHTPGSSECQIKKSTENNKRGSYDLHMDYFGFMGGEKTSNHIPWIPIDPSYIQQRFHKKGRIPATFEPRDYKQGMHKNKKRKKKRS